MSNVVFLGGGGHAKACLDVALSAGLRVAGFLGPDGAAASKGLEWIGTDDMVETLSVEGTRFLVAVGHTGDPELRSSLWRRIRGCSLTIRSPNATVSRDAVVGMGTAIFHHCHVGPCATIGENAILNTGSVVEHDAIIGDHVHVATRAVVNGGAEIGAGTLVGSGAIVLQGRRVLGGTILGAGAVVTRDILDGGTWVGVPARRVR